MVSSKISGTLEYTDILVEKKNGIGTIILNRPEKRNAMSMVPGGTCHQLNQAFMDMRDDPDIRVISLSGNGDCFTSGFDMSQYNESMWQAHSNELISGREREPWARLALAAPESPESKYRTAPTMWHDELWNNPKPSVAMVDSFCLGGGLWLINQMDVILATPDAVFAYPPIRYGASITTEILPPWILGLRGVMDMCLTGRFISAEEALNWGLISRIVPAGKLKEEGQKVCESIAKVPPMTNFCSKWAVHNYFEGLGIQQAMRFSQCLCIMTEQCSLPGHYWDFFDNLVFKLGFTEAYKIQREKWGYPDPVLDKEVARLKSKKGAK